MRFRKITLTILWLLLALGLALCFLQERAAGHHKEDHRFGVVTPIDVTPDEGDGGALETAITSGPTEGQMLRTNTTTFNFSHTGGDGSFECKLDEGTNQTGNWTACNSGTVTYNSMVDRPHTFSVRALNGGTPDTSPATRSFRSWNCGSVDDANTKNITVGMDVDATVNGDASGTSTEFCVHAGSHSNISQTVSVQSGDTLEGEPGSILSYQFDDGVIAAMADDAGAEISDSQTADGSGLAGVSVIVQLNGTAGISWIDCSGAHGQDSNGATVAGGTPTDGTGVCLKPGPGNESQPDHRFLEIHDNGAKGYGTTYGGIMNSHFYGNTENAAFLGFDGSTGKSTQEYEVGYNYVEFEEGMGPWCDHPCNNRSSQGVKGFWAHHNLVFRAGSDSSGNITNSSQYGIRHEYSPIWPDEATHPADDRLLCEGVPAGTGDYNSGTANEGLIPDECDATTMNNTVMENNIAVDNANAGLVCQAVQNCIIRNNDFPVPFSFDGKTFSHNGAAISGSQGKAIQIADSPKETKMWNADVYNNAIGDEHIQGCATGVGLFTLADEAQAAYCRNNNATGTATGSYDDAANSVQDNNDYGYAVLP